MMKTKPMLTMRRNQTRGSTRTPQPPERSGSGNLMNGMSLLRMWMKQQKKTTKRDALLRAHFTPVPCARS